MRIVAHHDKFYDWQAVPQDVVVTKGDVSSGRVKVASDGRYLMRVTREVEDGGTTHTEIFIPESEIIAHTIYEKCRPSGGRTLTRRQAVAFYIYQRNR